MRVIFAVYYWLADVLAELADLWRDLVQDIVEWADAHFPDSERRRWGR